MTLQFFLFPSWLVLTLLISSSSALDLEVAAVRELDSVPHNRRRTIVLIDNGIFRTEIARNASSPWAKTSDSTWSLSASSLGELLLFKILFGAHGGAPALRAKGLGVRIPRQSDKSAASWVCASHFSIWIFSSFLRLQLAHGGGCVSTSV